LDLEEIDKRHNLVDFLVHNSNTRQQLQDTYLRKFPDLLGMARKLHKLTASIQDIIRIYQVITMLPSLVHVLECTNDSAVHACFTQPFQQFTAALSPLQEMVEQTVDLEAADRHEYLLKGEFDESLRELKAEMNAIMDGMRAEHETVGELLELDTEKKLKLEKSTAHGYCFRVTRTVPLLCWFMESRTPRICATERPESAN
jgi:DNA mismatch repair protein MSH2